MDALAERLSERKRVNGASGKRCDMDNAAHWAHPENRTFESINGAERDEAT